jgi:hypothetical protein
MDLLANVPEYRAHLIRCLADHFLLWFYCWPFVAGFGRCSVHLLPGSSKSLFGRYGFMKRLLSTSWAQGSAERTCATSSAHRIAVQLPARTYSTRVPDNHTLLIDLAEPHIWLTLRSRGTLVEDPQDYGMLSHVECLHFHMHFKSRLCFSTRLVLSLVLHS